MLRSEKNALLGILLVYSTVVARLIAYDILSIRSGLHQGVFIDNNLYRVYTYTVLPLADERGNEMGPKLVAALPWLLEIAKKKEFPDSVFAVETITDVLWEIAKENGDDDPESSAVATAQCEQLGMSYEDILNLSTQTLSTELNTRFEKGKDFAGDLIYGLCMIAATELGNSGSEVIDVEWSMWEGYDPRDLIRLPVERFSLLPDIPYSIFSQIVDLYSRSGMKLDTLLGEIEFRMKQIFDRDKDKFVIQHLSEPQA